MCVYHVSSGYSGLEPKREKFGLNSLAYEKQAKALEVARITPKNVCTMKGRDRNGPEDRTYGVC